ncbi:MAG: hypothetical protein KDK12_05580 [Rhodobacteraceae bacterium]|nr:hypothetical protein [Paracoccaceae bacterium]
MMRFVSPFAGLGTLIAAVCDTSGTPENWGLQRPQGKPQLDTFFEMKVNCGGIVASAM